MRTHLLKLILAVSLPTTFSIALAIIVIFILCRRRTTTTESNELQHDVESPYEKQDFSGSETEEEEELVIFEGGEDLTICDILEAPGEVIGKSSYGTLYKASLQRSGKVRVLRFLRPLCAVRSDPEELDGVIESLGFVRHDYLVPLLGFYVGNRGEKLMIHPFFASGNLSEFIRCGDVESHKWSNILSITTGIAKALDHLHTGMQKPIVHGNLKSKNVLLDQSFRPRVSDFGLHLLLNLAAGQEILEASAGEGYKAPELIKMKEVSKESDVYSFGVIMLELVSSKLPTNKSSTTSSVLDNEKLLDLCRAEILGRGEGDGVGVTKEYVLEYIELAMSCCSPTPSLRPSFKQVLRKLEEIKK
ncbi:putative kinase-like protein TMKL1 isoform X2 [Brassica rapa]|uniref:Protein kinase domain-containing protein n=1 Tax=Brassica campestris TaxID=3711 RepID=M4D8Y2_BRACM|nr:putative kinase-like protein TMKL1 isoform X2 [Brassica rapa]